MSYLVNCCIFCNQFDENSGHVKNTLDSICTIYSIDSYGSVKQDLYYPEPLKRVEITDKALEMLGFKDLDVITLHDGTIMHKPTISVSFDHGTHITAQFLYESPDGIYKAFLRVTGGFFRRDGN